MKTLHILGIGGTFMSALAILARESGYEVSGCDMACYSPVSDLLAAKDIRWTEGYEVTEAAMSADVLLVGNAIKRGTPVLEAAMNARRPMLSGPQWLAETILPRYKVIAVSGTHGKTTTTAMITHILKHCGQDPGFLIGGVDPVLGTNAHLGSGEWFVIEADEYDSAFFDKRPKFMHYRPTVAILNNLEFDHADIYSDLAAIEQQFHYFLKTIPQNGMALVNGQDDNLTRLLQRGIFSGLQRFSHQASADWCARLLDGSGHRFEVRYQQQVQAVLEWSLIGDFNVLNGLAATAACAQTGLPVDSILQALALFTPVKRRLEQKACLHGISIYDDFAHHPTAIAKTIKALTNSKRHTRVIAVLELASFSMRQGVHKQQVLQALSEADTVIILQPESLSLHDMQGEASPRVYIETDIDTIFQRLQGMMEEGDGVLVMSNRSFGGLTAQLVQYLQERK